MLYNKTLKKIKHKEQPASVHWVACCERELKNWDYSGNTLIFSLKSHTKMQWYGRDLKALVKEIALAGVCWNMAIHVSVGSLPCRACVRTDDVKVRVKWQLQ